MNQTTFLKKIKKKSALEVDTMFHVIKETRNPDIVVQTKQCKEKNDENKVKDKTLSIFQKNLINYMLTF